MEVWYCKAMVVFKRHFRTTLYVSRLVLQPVTLEFALNDVLTMPSGKPLPSLDISSAFSCVTPTNDTSGWVKHAAGTDRWLSTCGRPHMFSTAEMP